MEGKSAAELFDIYDDTIRRIVDKHVPTFTTTVLDNKLSPWFDSECRHPDAEHVCSNGDIDALIELTTD